MEIVAAKVSMKMVMNTIQMAACGTESPVSGLNLPQIRSRDSETKELDFSSMVLGRIYAVFNCINYSIG